MMPAGLRAILCAGVLAVVATGCVALVVGGLAGAGTVLYVKGELTDRIDAPTDYVRKAISETIKSLQFTKVDAASDALSGRYEVKTSTGDSVTILYKRMADKTTSVSIRVGTFGDEKLSRAIMDEIRRQIPG